MESTIIAIDGYASTGKSTLSKRLAAHLGYTYVDTGYMFRAVVYGLQNLYGKVHPLEASQLNDFLEQCQFGWRVEQNGKHSMTVNGVLHGDELRTAEVSAEVSRVASIPAVRTHLLNQQHQLAYGTSVVMDGRDIGTVVFPTAKHKFFLTADANVRAARRWEEMKAKGQDIPYDAVLKNVIQRDEMDSTRAIAPLKKAEDAIEIDTTSLTVDEVFNRLIHHLQ